jgi:hypothetical protein
MKREKVLKNICLEYVEGEDVQIESDELFVLIPSKYAADLRMKLEQKGCIYEYSKKKHFLLFMCFLIT